VTPWRGGINRTLAARLMFGVATTLSARRRAYITHRHRVSRGRAAAIAISGGMVAYGGSVIVGMLS
jgi:uncharacterized membrane protein